MMMVDALGVLSDATVIEIGPGKGALTSLLCEKAKQVIVVEKDRTMLDALKSAFSQTRNIRFFAGDATHFDLSSILPAHEKALFISNLPFYASTAILFNVFRYDKHCLRAVFSFQREVAKRIVAKPGDRSLGALTVLVQMQASVEHLFTIRPEAFIPKPRVFTSVLRFTPLEEGHEWRRIALTEGFENFVHAVFRASRKTLANSLSLGLCIPKKEAISLLEVANIDPSLRAPALAIEDITRLWQAWKKVSS
jgi:16S rRNA (adenine1518-N6/adenine1519-N6)-dimethyltransferase